MKKKKIEGLNDCPRKFVLCENYIYGKENHVQFYLSSHESSRLLDLIYYDVFGPFKVPSIYKTLCYVSLIDDYSRSTWVYFLISKFEVFSQFKEFKYILENHTGVKIKVLRTDNGCDFFLATFDKFSKDNGIERNKTTQKTHYQNGV